MPRFQQSFNAMGPRSAAFAFAVLFSGWISNFFWRCFQVHPRTYTWTRFQALNAVYMKTTVDWRHFSSVEHYRQPSTFMYIGSTSQSVFRRESNRMSVAKKLTSGKEAQAELSIRFWVSNKSLQTYTLFLVTPCSTYKEAWVTEHCLIGMWQPKLNHP